MYSITPSGHRKVYFQRQVGDLAWLRCHVVEIECATSAGQVLIWTQASLARLEIKILSVSKIQTCKLELVNHLNHDQPSTWLGDCIGV